jgi:choline kinase
MKIQCIRKNDNIYEISKFGKKLSEYSAIDAGMFKLNYNFFDILEETILSGKDSLSDSCNSLAKNGKMLGLDIGQYLWLDVDTPEIIDQKKILDRIF